MKTVEVKYQTHSIDVSKFSTLEVTGEMLRAEEVITAKIMDDFDARIAASVGCMPPPYHSSHSFQAKMKHARTDLERSELATLKMLLETYLA